MLRLEQNVRLMVLESAVRLSDGTGIEGECTCITGLAPEEMRGKVDQLFDPNSLPGGIVLAIVNVLFFRGRFMFGATGAVSVTGPQEFGI